MRERMVNWENVLVGSYVDHENYGCGEICEVRDDKVKVMFDMGVKSFKFPECFIDHLDICNKNLRKEMNVYACYKVESERYLEDAKNEYIHKMVKLRKMENEICKAPSKFKSGKKNKVVVLPNVEGYAA